MNKKYSENYDLMVEFTKLLQEVHCKNESETYTDQFCYGYMVSMVADMITLNPNAKRLIELRMGLFRRDLEARKEAETI